MADPTISAVAPSPIFAGGQLVTITGMNFQLPFPPDLSIFGAQPPPAPPIAVTFNGKLAKKVAVLSSTSMTCLAPPGDAGAIEISLQNIDADGNPVGNPATFDGATYARADLSLTDDLDRFTKAVIQMLKQQVIPNVMTTVSVDYTDDAGKLAFNLVQTAKLPAISLVGPMTKRNKFYGDVAEIEQIGNEFAERRYMRTSDLIYKLTILDDNEMRLIRLGALVTKVLQNNTYFEFQADPNDLSKGFVEYELDATDVNVVGSPNNSNVRIATCEIRFSSFTFEDVAGFPGSMVDLQGAQADTVVLNIAGD